MRRTLASLLLVLFCAGLSLPLLQARPTGVPACCRRNGKHHCEASLKGDGIQAAAACCPYRAFTALTLRPIALPSAARLLAASLDCHRSVAQDFFSVAPPACDDTSQRGPPIA